MGCFLKMSFMRKHEAFSLNFCFIFLTSNSVFRFSRPREVRICSKMTQAVRNAKALSRNGNIKHNLPGKKKTWKLKEGSSTSPCYMEIQLNE